MNKCQMNKCKYGGNGPKKGVTPCPRNGNASFQKKNNSHIEGKKFEFV